MMKTVCIETTHLGTIQTDIHNKATREEIIERLKMEIAILKEEDCLALTYEQEIQATLEIEAYEDPEKEDAFFDACCSMNTIEELVCAGDPDDGELREWGITASQWERAVRRAIKWKNSQEQGDEGTC